METELRQIVQIGDLTLTGAKSLSADAATAPAFTAPAGKAGTRGLTTGTEINLAAGHGFAHDDKVSVFWADGSQSNASVHEANATSITLLLDGTGDALPDEGTAVTVAKDTAAAACLPPSNAVELAALLSDRRAALIVFDGASVARRFDLRAGQPTILRAGDAAWGPATAVKVAAGETAAAAIAIGILFAPIGYD